MAWADNDPILRKLTLWVDDDEKRGGTDVSVASLLVDAMGFRRVKRGRSAVRLVIDRLTDTGRLIIIDEPIA